MAFTDFQKHCKRCKKNKPCNRRHVYVMLLEPEVLSSRKFRKANPDYREGMPCLYVGKTSHHPRCRQSMHNNCRTGAWEEETWVCYCNKKPGKHLCSLGTRGSKTAGRYSTGFLKPKLYKDFNPQKGLKANSEAEMALARHLRELGYGVWAGHLDKQKSSDN